MVSSGFDALNCVRARALNALRTPSVCVHRWCRQACGSQDQSSSCSLQAQLWWESWRLCSPKRSWSQLFGRAVGKPPGKRERPLGCVVLRFAGRGPPIWWLEKPKSILPRQKSSRGRTRHRPAPPCRSSPKRPGACYVGLPWSSRRACRKKRNAVRAARRLVGWAALPRH